MQRLLLRYTQFIANPNDADGGVTAITPWISNFAAWLSLSLDRLPVNELVMTQESIANILGVPSRRGYRSRRQSATSRLVRYSRGHIEVLNRPGLEARTCECYAVVKKEPDRLLPETVQA
jgi:hypothetical protein